jgi:aryl-alcohol dehydrogenase-like predicted oxidoreductase
LTKKKLFAQLRAAIDQVETAQSEIDRLAAANTLRQLADKAEREMVAEARAAGVRWIDIGELYGTSKQSVQQRFRVRDVPDQK